MDISGGWAFGAAMSNKTYDDNTKAAVMAALLAGQSVSSVAKEYKIPKGTVSGWKAKASGVGSATTQKKEEIGDLIIHYLEASLKTLKVQAEQFSSIDWLNKQNAADVAVLHGVLTDKAIRLIEAFGDSDTDTED